MGVSTRILVACAACVAWGCAEEERAEVPLAEVIKGPLVFEGTYYGELQAANSVAIHVPNIPGTWSVTVDDVAEDGERVSKDDVVLTFARDTFEMDLRDELDKLDVAQAERRKVAQGLSKERIDLELAVQRQELAVERAKLQVVEGVNLISKLELDKARIDVEKAELELELARQALTRFERKRATAMKVEDLKVEAAERAVANKRAGLELIEVKAPVDGMVYAPYTRLNWTRTKVAPGVVARPGDKALELPDLSKFNAHVYVRQRDAALIKVGDTASVTPVILPDVVIEAKVIKKEEFATTRNERLGTKTPAGQIKEYRVELELSQAPDELRPGNSARVTMRSTLADDVVTVPLGALVQDPKTRAWSAVLADGSMRAVEIGRATPSRAEVVSGLEPGEQVRLGSLGGGG